MKHVLPEQPPGDADELAGLLETLVAQLPDELRAREAPHLAELAPAFQRIATTTLAKARRNRVGVGYALEAIARTCRTLETLDADLNAIPEPLGYAMAAHLRNLGFQHDALWRVRQAIDVTEQQARDLLGLGPDDPPPKGPGDLVSRLSSDAADYLIGECIALFVTFRPADLKPSPEAELGKFVAAFWTFATGEEEGPASLDRRLRRALAARVDGSPA